MDADWYEDPLRRFDGRFFDGQKWTERVSENGALRVDPDFPPALTEPFSEPSKPEALSDASTAPAVVPVTPPRRLQASLMQESPARTVAVLTDPDGVDVATARNRTPAIWGLAGLIAALLVAGLLIWDRGQTNVVAEPVDLDQDQEARVQDLEAGGDLEEIEPDTIEQLEVDAPAGTVDSSATFDAAEIIEVGGLQVVNGASLLADLATWHQGFAAERGITLDPAASCWFGQLGGAAVQVAHCGPVSGTETTEFVFDSVPLVFEESDAGQIAQPVIDAVTADAVLANALTLVGSPDHPPPGSLGGG